MKRAFRYFGLLLFIFTCLYCIGCGGNSKYDISKEAASIGKKALEVTDQFLDGDIDYDTASKKLKNFGYQIDAIAEEDSHCDGGMVSTSVKAIGATMYSYDLYNSLGKDTSSDYKEIMAARDRLADELGEK